MALPPRQGGRHMDTQTASRSSASSGTICRCRALCRRGTVRHGLQPPAGCAHPASRRAGTGLIPLDRFLLPVHHVARPGQNVNSAAAIRSELDRLTALRADTDLQVPERIRQPRVGQPDGGPRSVRGSAHLRERDCGDQRGISSIPPGGAAPAADGRDPHRRCQSPSSMACYGHVTFSSR